MVFWLRAFYSLGGVTALAYWGAIAHAQFLDMFLPAMCLSAIMIYWPWDDD